MLLLAGRKTLSCCWLGGWVDDRAIGVLYVPICWYWLKMCENDEYDLMMAEMA
jgi:hypothetical protein